RSEVPRAGNGTLREAEHADRRITTDNAELLSAVMHANRQRTLQRERAFTLLEILLALAISAIVLAGIGTVFYGAIHLRDRTAAAIEASVPITQALGIIRRDLLGA